MRILCALRAIGVFTLILAAAAGPARAQSDRTPDVPYVPTPANVVDAMFEMAKINAGDYLIDLGSGDGRIVIEAAKKFGVRGMGVELDANLVSTANAEAKRQGVAGKATFVRGDLFNLDFSSATVLTLYLYPHINVQLRPRILALKPGTRVVSHDFDIGAWQPDQRREIAVPDKPYGAPVSSVYMWIVPADVAGNWRWQMPLAGAPSVFEAVVEQRFQELAAVAIIDGLKVPMRNLKLSGSRISFSLTREMNGRPVTHEFTGRVNGDAAAGNVRSGAGAEANLDWTAARVARGKMRTE